jgi:aminoacrylate hydrolase
MVQYASWTKADAHFRLCFDVRTQLLDISEESYVHATPLFLMPSWWIRDNVPAIRRGEMAALADLPDRDIVKSRIDAILAFDLGDRLNVIRTPTLVLCAADDILTPTYFSHDIAQRIPGAELVVLKTGGHACSQATPQEFNDAVLDFLLRHARSVS